VLAEVFFCAYIDVQMLHMKLLSLTTPFLLLMALNACKKESINNNNDQGITYNHLIKTIAKLNPATGKEITTEYQYNSNDLVSQIKTTDNTSGSSQQSIETFFRNSAGKLDSIVYAGNTGNAYSSKTWFYYDGMERLTLSKYDFIKSGVTSRKDSSVYEYSGSVLNKRTDYRSFDGGSSYSLLTEASFEFDAAGNVSRSIFNWAVSPNTTDTLNFKYDTKANPVPKADGFFYWAPVFYNDYKMQNNLLQLNGSNGNERSSYEYGYAPNNKPLYRKQTDPANFVYETFYYYD
jgi:hypothetical protein